MLASHPENVATLLVVGGLAMLLLRHLMVWRLDGSRSHLPWVLISASGIAFGVLRIAHLSTDSPDHGLALSRGLYAVPMFLMPLGVAAVETLTERPRSRTAFRLGVVTALLALATVATPWLVVGPPQLRHDAFGHRFWVGRAGPGLIALALVIAWTGRHLYRAVRALPVELRGMRRWLRLPVLTFMALGAHDTLLAAGLRSIHLFEYGFLVFAAVATQFETLRGAAVRAGLTERLEAKRVALEAKEASLDRARAELAVTHQRLVRADRMAALGTLAAGTAHEINNPLTFIAGNAELLGDALAGLAPRLPPDATAEAQAMLRDIGAGTERIKGVVQQLLALAKDDQAAAAPVDVRGLVDVSLAMAGHHLKHRAQVVRDFDEVPPVFASAARLGQVFLNLIVNAAQAIPAGAADANQVRVAIRAAAERVVVEIVDTGVGMPPDVLARIFDPFFTTKDAGHGTGLGLSISQGIVEELGGTIDVASTPGHGTTVRVELPACAAPVVDAPGPAPAPAPRPPRTVLVVDDEALVGRAVARLIGGAHIEVAASGRDALARGLLRRFDVIVCDLMMPEMTGIELYRRAIAEAPALASRFVFLTGGVFTDEARAFVDEPGRRCLTKPVERAELLAAIEAAAAA